jgi:hypothetical protein
MNIADGYAQVGFANDAAIQTDPAPVPAIYVNNTQFWTGSNFTIPQYRSTASLNFTLSNRVALATNQILVIDIPPSWIDILLSSAGVTGVIQYQSATGAQSAGVLLGIQANYIRFNLSVALAANTTINISLSGIRLPDGLCGGAVNYISESPRIAVFNHEETSIIAKSSPANAPFKRDSQFGDYDDSISTLNWPENLLKRGPIRLFQGTAQNREQYIVLSAGSTAFNKAIVISVASNASGVQLIPGTGIADVGDSKLLIGLQALGTANLGITNVVFNKVETAHPGGSKKNRYAPLPSLKVLLKSMTVPSLSKLS